MSHIAKARARLVHTALTGNRRPRVPKIMRAFGALIVVLLIAIVAVASFFPELAAQNIDQLRNIIGDAPVAQLEGIVFGIQDFVQHSEYQLGILNAAAPWAISSTDKGKTAIAKPTTNGQMQAVSILPSATIQSTVLPSALPPVLLPSASSIVSSIMPTALITSSSLPSSPHMAQVSQSHNFIPSSTTAASMVPTTTAILLTSIISPAWQLSPLKPLGKLSGEGQWVPYLQTADGHLPVAYRTFLQPDPQRPYAVPAIVAINLQVTHLHYVLGTIDPASATPQPSRTGTIPVVDMQPGILLATFNGGFKARHGRYGAMADGLVALPAINGLATVAIYTDGHVKIGEWGTDINNTTDLVAWRQNGKMLIHNGQINPATVLPTSSWGLTIQGTAITWRSALGISADGHTLYYVAGPHLDASTLAKAIAQTGAVEALQLDINYTLVHFTAIQNNGSSLMAEPLLNEMSQKLDRYLKTSTNDFFYITLDTRSSQ